MLTHDGDDGGDGDDDDDPHAPFFENLPKLRYLRFQIQCAQDYQNSVWTIVCTDVHLFLDLQLFCENHV